MSKFLLVSFLCLLIPLSFTAYGQPKLPQKTEREVKMMLCHRWKLTHMEASGKRMKLPPEMGEATVTFNSDGTLIEADEGQRFAGKWAYIHKSMSLITDDRDGKQKQTILKITPAQLILKADYQGMAMNMIMSRID